MSNKNTAKLDSFQSWCHLWGRVGTVIALVYMVALPFVVLGFYDSIPSLGEVFNIATFGILAIYIPVGISEALSYTPLMGASSYLGFITGNIMNLKLPCAVNALKLTGKQANTPEGDVVASIAVAASSIMTVAILTVAALLIRMISPIFELPAVQTMSSYLLPALFGSMTLGLFASTGAGPKVVKGGLKGVIPVIILVSLIALANRILNIMPGTTLMGMVGFLITAVNHKDLASAGLDDITAIQRKLVDLGGGAQFCRRGICHRKGQTGSEGAKLFYLGIQGFLNEVIGLDQSGGPAVVLPEQINGLTHAGQELLVHSLVEEFRSVQIATHVVDGGDDLSAGPLAVQLYGIAGIIVTGTAILPTEYGRTGVLAQTVGSGAVANADPALTVGMIQYDGGSLRDIGGGICLHIVQLGPAGILTAHS